ncbi:MAG: molybdenum cofactor biosynthesis protein MoaE [Candidatus Hadarchaeales archaeon]
MAEAGVHRRGDMKFEEVLEKFREGLSREVGGIGCFIGVVRGIAQNGKSVKMLHYESADEAVEDLRRIAVEIERIHGVESVAIHHFVDDLLPGEDTIYVLVAGRGREDVFRALQDVMIRVKREPLVWKKEITEDGERWVR